MWIRMTVPNNATAGPIRAKLRLGGVQRIVVEDRSTTIALVRDDHIGGNGSWLSKLAGRYNLSWTEVEEPKTVFETRCKKVEAISEAAVLHHQSRCNSCRALPGETFPRPEGSPSTNGRRTRGVAIKVKAPGIQEFSLNGMVSLMRERYDEALTIADQYDKAIKAVEGLDEYNLQLTELSKKMEDDKTALAYFLEENKKKSGVEVGEQS